MENDDLIDKIVDEQNATLELLGKLMPDDELDVALELIIAKQRDISHLIDRILEDDQEAS